MTETTKEYAVALFTLATETNQAQDFSEQLVKIGNVIEENPDYIKFLDSPAIPLSERLLAIDKAFENYPEYIISFLKILIENRRITHLQGCIKEFNELLKLSENRAVATVYYVEPLNDQQKDALIEKLCKVSGKNVEATYIQDKSLIGGIKVVLDDKTIDGSIAHRLNKTKGVIS